MSRTKLTATEAVRINGQWRTVEVYADTLVLAVQLGNKAARNKTLKSKVVFGGVMVKVLPLVNI